MLDAPASAWTDWWFGVLYFDLEAKKSCGKSLESKSILIIDPIEWSN